MSQLERDLTDLDIANHWVDVGSVGVLLPDRGVCALVEGQPVAVFRCSPDGELYAIGNIDPYSGASVLSRGIVGSIDGRPVVASPIFKQRFDLRTGQSLSEPAVAVPTYDVRTTDDRIWILAPSAPLAGRPHAL